MEKRQGNGTDTLQTDNFSTRKEYIEREATLEEIVNADVMCDIPADAYRVLRRYIERIPAADVVPVRHGQWIDKPGGTYQRMQSWCSVCGKRSGIGGIESNRHKPYCPNCGARMDGDGE